MQVVSESCYRLTAVWCPADGGRVWESSIVQFLEVKYLGNKLHQSHCIFEAALVRKATDWTDNGNEIPSWESLSPCQWRSTKWTQNTSLSLWACFTLGLLYADSEHQISACLQLIPGEQQGSQKKGSYFSSVQEICALSSYLTGRNVASANASLPTPCMGKSWGIIEMILWNLLNVCYGTVKGTVVIGSALMVPSHRKDKMQCNLQTFLLLLAMHSAFLTVQF